MLFINFNFKIFDLLSVYLILPEIFIFINFIVFFIILFLISIKKIQFKFLNSVKFSLIFYSQIVIFTIFLYFNNINYNYNVFYFNYVSNFYINLIKILFLFLFLLFLFLLKEYLYINKIYIIEYVFLFCMTLIASLLVCSSSDFISLYLILELQNICLYILISLKRNSNLSLEASLKYFIISSITMGFFLYGVSLCYFSSGALNFFDLEIFLWNFSFDPIMLFGYFFIFCSLIIKIGLPPFFL